MAVRRARREGAWGPLLPAELFSGGEGVFVWGSRVCSVWVGQVGVSSLKGHGRGESFVYPV